MNETPNREVAVFAAALELPGDKRVAYLDQACEGDIALRRQVEALLRVHDDAGNFFDKLASVAQSTSAEGSTPGSSGTIRLPVIPSEKPGDRIGRYKLLQQIGEGGCGVVYMAEQEEPVRRRVALKVIKLGMDTKSVIARFEAERQALALMDHPNIAKVLDAGATETGRPYFVMELVRGIKITDYCDDNNLGTTARLELFIQVCQAIQHAHQKGIIHRDIKPSNILVADHDGKPVPKVIDFGIAKATTDQRLTDKTVFTAFEQFIGTPAYMSPEQARLSGLDIDTRSDIYSLGVLLYELLTAKTPFESKRLLEMGLDEIRRIIREEEALRPSARLQTLDAAEQTTVARRRQSEPPKLLGIIRGDLDWIVMKCLEKDRGRRYETANGLAADVKRHLSNEPVVARPPSNSYRLQKLILRNKLAFAAVAVVAVALIAASAVALVAAIRIQDDNGQIRKVNQAVTEKLWGAYLLEARLRRVSRGEGQRFASLLSVSNAAAICADISVRNEAIACLAVPDLRVSKEFRPGERAVNDTLFCCDFDLERYAEAQTNGSILIRAVSNDLAVAELPAPGLTVNWIFGFSPNSRYLKVRYWRGPEGKTDWIWDLKNQTTMFKFSDGNQWEDISSDSRLLGRCQPDGSLSVYDLGTGKELKRLPGTRQFDHLIFSPDNTMLACSSEEDPAVEIHSIESGRIIRTLNCAFGVRGSAWSPDGKRLATACGDYQIRIWNAETGQQQVALEGHVAPILTVAFNHAGNLLASASFDGLVRLWDAETGSEVASHPGGSWQLRFSPDDRQLLGWGYAGHYGSLEVSDGRECRRLHAGRIGTRHSGPEFSADGQILAAGTGSQVRFWDVFSGREIALLLMDTCDAHPFSPDGESLFLTQRSGGIVRRSLERTGAPGSFAYKLGIAKPFYDMSDSVDAVISRDGRYIAAAEHSDGQTFVLNLHDPSAKAVPLRVHPLVDYIAISPDGHWLATASWQNSLVKVWNARSGDLVRTLSMPNRAQVAFSPDGRWLATSTSEYQLWEVGSWQPKGPAVPGNAIPEWNFTAFSPDGRVMTRTLEGHKIQFVETLTEKSLATLESPGSSVIVKFQFSPDGTHLAAMQMDHQVQLWDLRLIRQELAQMHLDWPMPPYPAVGRAETENPATLEVESNSTDRTPGR